jgi:hypothetical protein
VEMIDAIFIQDYNLHAETPDSLAPFLNGGK